VRRIVLLLMVASVVMFIFVLKTPGRLLRSTILGQDESKQATEKADATKTLPGKAAKSAKRSARAPQASRRTSPDTPLETGMRTPTKPEAGIRPSKSDLISPKTLTVAGDAAMLYPINSSKSNVLTVLSKGTLVEPNLQIIDAADNWTLVRVPTLNLFGFVQTGNLARPSQETVSR
jgi:hypothetical protein